MAEKFLGTGVAIVTPFGPQGKIDYPGLQRLVEHLITNGIDYLVVQGTTGESPVLSKEEKRASVDFVVEVAAGRVPVVLGHGGSNTQEVVEGFANFDFSKIDGLLSVSPAYNKPNQRGILAHFAEVSKASPVPVILYNVPHRTGSNMTAETTLQLAHDFDNIVATKEASGDLNQIGRIIRDRPEGFLVISGDDNLIIPHMALGGDGIISVTANALPAEYSAVVKAAAAGDFKTAQAGFYQLIDLFPLLFSEGNPGGVKAALEVLEVCSQHVRLPNVPVSQETYDRIQSFLTALKHP